MGSDWYTPSQAARILSRSGKAVSGRRVRQMLQAGEIEGERSESGRWRISQGVVHELLKERREALRELSEINSPALGLDTGTESTDTALYGPESVRELFDRVEALSRELGRSEARLELTERAESSVREERDMLRAELEAEREERRRLSGRLERLRESSTESPKDAPGGGPESLEAPESPENVSEGYGSGSTAPGAGRGAESPSEGFAASLRGLASRLLRGSRRGG